MVFLQFLAGHLVKLRWKLSTLHQLKWSGAHRCPPSSTVRSGGTRCTMSGWLMGSPQDSQSSRTSWLMMPRYNIFHTAMYLIWNCVKKKLTLCLINGEWEAYWDRNVFSKKKLNHCMFFFSKAMTATLCVLSYFLSIFFDQNQWEYDDSTDHVSSTMKIKLPIFISLVFSCMTGISVVYIRRKRCSHITKA